MHKLTAAETIETIRLVHNLLSSLTSAGALAGVVLTNDAYDRIKEQFGSAAIPYQPAPPMNFDPRMEHAFVVDGLLIMRGTQLQ